MGERIIEVERGPEELVVRLRLPRIGVLSDEARGHIRAARKELLLSLRSLIDQAIQHTEEVEKKRGQGVTKIKVE